MAARTSATFAKRQKERARQERQQAKQQRRFQRKLEKSEAQYRSESAEFGANTEVVPHSEPISVTTMAAVEIAATERKD